MTAASFRETFRIASAHPALPGHFPGRPVVPGVVLLDHVAAALERWRGLRITAIGQVKFLGPLLPDEAAELVLDDADGALRFRIARGAATIATGTLEAGA